MDSGLIRYPEWIYRQTAALPYRRGADGLQVLLVTSRSGRRWGLPKGVVDPGLTAPEMAAKEAWEEAGIEGRMGTKRLGRYRYKKWGGTCAVEVFPMAVSKEHDDWPEAGRRQREWCSVAEALDRIGRKKLRKIIRRFAGAVASDTDVRYPSTGAVRDGPVTRWAPKRLIHLLRHAESSRDDPDHKDFDRPLTEAGKGALEKMREYIAFAEIAPDLVVCSPAKRTRQTLEHALPDLSDGSRVRFARGLYGVGLRGLMNRLRAVPRDLTSVMLIGHNPGLQALAVELAGGGDEMALKRMRKGFPPGALATLVLQPRDWAQIGRGTCELHSFVVPEQL